MLSTAQLAYKGLGMMPTWFIVVIAVPAAVGIVLAYRRGR